MKTTTVLRLGLLALVIALAFLLLPQAFLPPQAVPQQLVRPVYAHPARTIDPFSASQVVTQTGTGATFGYINSDTVILNQREVTVSVTSGSGYLYFDANGSVPGAASHSQGVAVYGRTILTYDGDADGGAAGVDPDGLGSVNLEEGGDTAFIVLINASDHNGYVKITYYSDNSTSTCSSLTKRLPAPLSISQIPRAIIFRYADFTQDGACSAAANKNAVGAIVLEIDGTATENDGWDVSIDLLETNRMDLGDLPSSYQDTDEISITTLDRGAAHVTSGLKLGSNWDAESDGQENANAVGDDNNPPAGPDDEDGVVLNSTVAWTTGTQVSVTVTIAGGNGCLSAWIDWNKNNFFASTERVITNSTVTTGSYVYTFTVGSHTGDNVFFSRWRLFARQPDNTCPDSGTDPLPYYDYISGTGVNTIAPHYYGGEVEDHKIGVAAPTAVNLSTLTAQAMMPDLPWLPLAFGVIGIAGLTGVMLARRRRRQ